MLALYISGSQNIFTNQNYIYVDNNGTHILLFSKTWKARRFIFQVVRIYFFISRPFPLRTHELKIV